MKQKKKSNHKLGALALAFVLITGANINSAGAFVPAEEIHINDIAAEEDVADPFFLTLVNASNPLPESFEPDLDFLPNGQQFDRRALPSLVLMIEEAKEDGMNLVISSAYRSIGRQSWLFAAQVGKMQGLGLDYAAAFEKARTVVAYPGESEHNLGLAADIVSKNYRSLDEGFAETEEGKWLKENSWKYGFILRYPEDKTDITGIIFEPWHFRYVGPGAAKYITENGICLEEYADIIANPNTYSGLYPPL